MGKEKARFETAFGRLEELVAEIEEGGLSLDDTLEKYSEAVKALKLCRKMLGDAEKKIEALTEDEKGNLKTKAASLGAEKEDES